MVQRIQPTSEESQSICHTDDKRRIYPSRWNSPEWIQEEEATVCRRRFAFRWLFRVRGGVVVLRVRIDVADVIVIETTAGRGT